MPIDTPTMIFQSFWLETLAENFKQADMSKFLIILL
jgi:hypothetical protein